MEEFPALLKRCRENLKDIDSKWTQRYVAEKIGVARVTYTGYENGSKSPPIDIVRKLADLFDVSTDYLLGKIKNPKSSEGNQREAIIHKIATEFPDSDLMFEGLQSMNADQLKEVYNFIKYTLDKKEE